MIKLTRLKPHKELSELEDYEPWMSHYISWDIEDRCFVGWCPDTDEICRDADPARFLMLFKEASNEWVKQQ